MQAKALSTASQGWQPLPATQNPRMPCIDSPADQRRRQRLVRDALSGCSDPRVVAAMASLPRHCFCLEGSAAAAYADHALAIGAGQTISQPSLIAAMLAFLQIRSGMQVMDIGSGSGYVTALLARLLEGQGQVLALERIAVLQQRAADVCSDCLTQEENDCITWQLADASCGCPERGPCDAIHVACVFPELPGELLEQLKAGGRMIIPVGSEKDQSLIGVMKNDDGTVNQEQLMKVLFVPLLSGTE